MDIRAHGRPPHAWWNATGHGRADGWRRWWAHADPRTSPWQTRFRQAASPKSGPRV